MKNLTSSTWITAKGILFLLLGLLSATLLFFEHPTPKTGLLVIIAVWSFCRFYYFAFYVIEHYVDPSYAFPGFYLLLDPSFRKNDKTLALAGEGSFLVNFFERVRIHDKTPN
jgi:hypothetical protein